MTSNILYVNDCALRCDAMDHMPAFDLSQHDGSFRLSASRHSNLDGGYVP